MHSDSTLPGARPSSAIPGLDGLRAIAFLLVFVAHAGLDKIVPGGFGVSLFFFLSGYLITTLLRVELQQTQTISLKAFYTRRAFRILPPLYVTLLLGYALGAAGLLREPGNFFGFLAASAYFYNYTDLLHLPAILPTGTGVLWSLMVEEHFYLVFPFFYKACMSRPGARPRVLTFALLTLCGAALLWRCYLIFIVHTPLLSLPRWTYSASDTRFDSILFGCILAVRNNAWLRDPSPWLGRFKGAFAGAGILALLASLLIREPHFRETLRYTIQSVALYPVFYYCIAASDQWQVRWLEWRPLRVLGWLSYSLYLVHFIPLGIGYERFPSHRVIVAIISFALALLYASLMRLLIEQPIRLARSRVTQRALAVA